MIRVVWTPEMEEDLYTHYGTERVTTTARRLSKKYGVPLTREKVLKKAERLGIDFHRNQDAVTLADAAAALGVTYQALQGRIASGSLKVFGTGGVRLIRLEDFEALKAEYPPLPVRWISTLEAGRRLGFAKTRMNQLVRRGVVRAVRHGGKWRVDVDHVDAILRERRRAC